MFELDILVYNYIFSKCKALGSIFGFGAFEGFVMYLGLITLVVLKVTSITKKGRK